jgi:hypothetical protein
MKNMKKILLLGVMVLALGTSTLTAFAAASAPVSGSGSASLDDLKAQRLEVMKERMADRVEAGLMTQEQADYMLEWMEKNQAVCNGAGGYGYGRTMGQGAGYGMMGGWNQ